VTVDLLVIVPSRGRPRDAGELIQAFRETQSGRAKLLFALDEDDPCLNDYLALRDEMGDVWFDVGPRLRLCGSLNSAALRNYQFYTYLAFWGDDVRPRTFGWDEFTCEALSQSPASFAFWDDLFPGNRGRLPCSVSMTSDVVLALGYMAPSALVHMHLDTAWKLWGEALGRLIYLHDVIVEHLHRDIGHGVKDETYFDTVAQYGPDQAHWADYQGYGLHRDIEKLKALGNA
jgi:hypothetical protein